MTDEDRTYYRGRYEYAVQKAGESDDPNTKAAHLAMAAQYRQRAGLDHGEAADRPIAAGADVEGRP